jgi:hypothetical protein
MMTSEIMFSFLLVVSNSFMFWYSSLFNTGSFDKKKSARCHYEQVTQVQDTQIHYMPSSTEWLEHITVAIDVFQGAAHLIVLQKSGLNT